MNHVNSDYGYDENGEPFVTPPPLPVDPGRRIPTYEEFSRALMAPQSITEPFRVSPGPAPFAPAQQPFAPQATQNSQMTPQEAESRLLNARVQQQEATAQLRGAQARQVANQFSETGIFDTHYEDALKHFGDMRKNLIHIKGAGGIGGKESGLAVGDPGFLRRNLTEQMSGLIPYVERVVQSVPKTRTEAMGGPGEIMRLTGGQMEGLYKKPPGGGGFDPTENILLTNVHQPRTPATQTIDPVRAERSRNLVDNAGATLVGFASEAFPQINIAGDTNKKIVPLESLDSGAQTNVNMVLAALEGWMDKGMFSPGRQKQMAAFIGRFSRGGIQLKYYLPGHGKTEPNLEGVPSEEFAPPSPWGTMEPTREWLKKYFGDRPGMTPDEYVEAGFLESEPEY